MSDVQPSAAFFRELAGAVVGDVRTDRLARTLYATDASIYEIVPDGVVLPRCTADIVSTVRLCAQYGVPVTARGAGTGLTGGCVNRGVQLDLSRYLNRILHIDARAGTAHVEPGVVLDELNAAIKPHGLQFAPDVATSSRATIGGMIANNSCGAHSLIYGRTVDHILALDVVLSDGSRHTYGAPRGLTGGAQEDVPQAAGNALAARGDALLSQLRSELADEIAARYPKVLRSNGGYALDRLRVDGGRLTTERLLSGSEGTLGIITSAVVKLIALPRHKGLVVVHFAALQEALNSVPKMLKHQPAAVELIDKFITDASKDNPTFAHKRGFLQGDPAAILIVEFYEEDAGRLQERMAGLAADLRGQGCGYAWPLLTDATQQQYVWDVRKAGTGLLMSRPGERQPYDFVDDTAVDPAVLGPYMEKFRQIMVEEGCEQAGYYAHASVGCLHVRPVLNLRRRDDIERMHRIADRVSSLALEYGGTMTGEHGDGLVRSCWLEKMYGPRLTAAFRQIKETFDPQNILNPGKIVNAPAMTANLRYGEGYRVQQPLTLLDFSAHGGMAGLAEMCSGLGQCRQKLIGTLCPSYMATGDERHTTRARANALRVALSNRGLLEGLSDPALEEVMDLCLACKACKTECPTGTDMAKLKAEWLHHRNERVGVPRRSRLIASSIDMAKWGCHFAPLSNWVMQAKVTRVIMEHLFGLDRRVPPPEFARTTFRDWFASKARVRHAEAGATVPARQVIYYVDTWTNFYQPQVGEAAVKVLTALGYEVLVLPHPCCGRPLISKGLLTEARRLAEANAEVLGPWAERDVPIVGTEPSCISALNDELPQLVRTGTAKRVAATAVTIEHFVAEALRQNPSALRFRADAPKLLYHGHCHVKALGSTADAIQVLSACTAGQASEINSGCCGMAGSFGHEVEHYDVAKAVGEQRLFPAVRARGDAQIAISGFSCRHHIGHHTGVHPKHVVEYLADALA
jgi:FAD/FMN-containing dehydrogenase/Fe-S oxidoreductase